MTINLRAFFAVLRGGLYGGRLSRGQVDGINAVLRRWQLTMPGGDPRWLAYMLATVFHETARTMQPVRETLAASDAEAVARLDRAFAEGRLAGVAEPYWRADGEGKSWFGRGLVQITHKRNYRRLGDALGIDLVADPGRALDMDVALAVMFAGMTGGLFTGHGLAQFFDSCRNDWTGARKIVNGTDRAETIAGYGRQFLAAFDA